MARYPTVAIINLETAEAVALTDNLVVNQADTTRKAALSSILSSLGLMRCIFFSEGGALENKKDIAFNEEDGTFYTWNGSYPKFIEAGSTPRTSGGLGSSAFTPLLEDDSDKVVHYLGDVGSSLTINPFSGRIFTFSLTEPTTSLSLEDSPVISGYTQECSLVITQKVGGSVIAWPSNIYWPDGEEPILSSTQGSVDIINLITFDDGQSWFGSSLITTPTTVPTLKEITGTFSTGSYGFIRLSSSIPVSISVIATSRSEGFELTLMVEQGSEKMVTLETDTGNMLLNGNFTFNSETSLIRLLYTKGSWVELFRSGR